ncbi:MAG: LamG-like jellyroll fold domain-containing protein [Candidatus Paceibacterota bacterium]|jgi:prepilin-type N-terminal cleavage/methylation domain-containing protein
MNRKGFTLIELLVVIAIVGILSSVIYTNITGLRDRARITAGIRFDSSTLHSIGDQLVREYTFDMPQVGSLTYDTSGFGNNGTITGATYAATSGYNNKGTYSFDGSDYISTPNLELSYLTVTAWINTSNPSIAYQAIVTKADQTATTPWDFRFIGSSGGKIHLAANIGGVYAGYALSDITLKADTWYHVAATYDGSRVRIYIDGVKHGETAATGVIYSKTLNVMIGARNPSAPENFFVGKIDDVRIYDSALSSSDIQKLYVEGKANHEVATK